MGYTYKTLYELGFVYDTIEEVCRDVIGRLDVDDECLPIGLDTQGTYVEIDVLEVSNNYIKDSSPISVKVYVKLEDDVNKYYYLTYRIINDMKKCCRTCVYLYPTTYIDDYNDMDGNWGVTLPSNCGLTCHNYDVDEENKCSKYEPIDLERFYRR